MPRVKTDKYTQKYYTDLGFHIHKAEKYINIPGQPPRKRDFLNIIDYLVWGQCTTEDDLGFFSIGEWYTLGIQTTSRSALAPHRNKMLKSATFPWWTEHPNHRTFLQGWDLHKNRYRHKTEELTMKDWTTYQTELEAKNVLDKTSPLYRELILGEKV